MKLRDKKQIAADIASQRKADIDKGIALATKVDAVRATLSEEERNLENFRSQATAQVREEIDILLQNRSRLAIEVKELGEERERLLIPLDARWEAVKERERTLNDWAERIKIETDALRTKREDMEKREAVVKQDEKRAEELSHVASQRFAEADSTLKTARENAAEMRNLAQIALTNAELKEKEADRLVIHLNARIESVDNHEKTVVQREVEVIQLQRQLRDQYATLERTKKRING